MLIDAVEGDGGLVFLDQGALVFGGDGTAGGFDADGVPLLAFDFDFDGHRVSKGGALGGDGDEVELKRFVGGGIPAGGAGADDEVGTRKLELGFLGDGLLVHIHDFGVEADGLGKGGAVVGDGGQVDVGFAFVADDDFAVSTPVFGIFGVLAVFFGGSFVVGVLSVIPEFGDVAKVVGGPGGGRGVVAVEAGAPVDGGFAERFAHVIIGAQGNGDAVGLNLVIGTVDEDFEAVGFVFVDAEVEVSGVRFVFASFSFGEDDAGGIPADGGFWQREGVGPGAIGAEGDGLMDDLAVAGIVDDEGGGKRFFAQGKRVAAALTSDGLEVGGVAGFVDGSVGKEHGLLGGGPGIVPANVDAMTPEADAGFVVIDVDRGGVIAVASEHPAGVFAGADGDAAGVGGNVVEEGAVAVHEGELDIGEWLAGFVGEGVDEGFLVVVFEKQADVGEFDDGTADDGACGSAILGGGGHFDENGRGGGFAEDVAPFEVMESGFFEGLGVGEVGLVDSGAGKFFKRRVVDAGGGDFGFGVGFVGFVVKGAGLDEFALRELFDADVEVLVVGGVDVENAVAVGLLGAGFGGGGEENGARAEGDGFLGGRFEGEVIGAGEAFGDGDVVGGVELEVAGDDETGVIGADAHVGDGGRDVDEAGKAGAVFVGGKVAAVERFGEGDDDFVGAVEVVLGGDFLDGEGKDGAPGLGVVRGDGGVAVDVGDRGNDVESPGIADGERFSGGDDDGVVTLRGVLGLIFVDDGGGSGGEFGPGGNEGGIVVFLEVLEGGRADGGGDALGFGFVGEVEVFREVGGVDGVVELDEVVGIAAGGVAVDEGVVALDVGDFEGGGGVFAEVQGRDGFAGGVLEFGGEGELVDEADVRGFGEMELTAAGAGPFEFAGDGWLDGEGGGFGGFTDLIFGDHGFVEAQFEGAGGQQFFGGENQFGGGRGARQEEEAQGDNEEVGRFHDGRDVSRR